MEDSRSERLVLDEGIKYGFMKKAFNLNVEEWLAYEYAKWAKWLRKCHKTANLLLKGACQQEAAEFN